MGVFAQKSLKPSTFVIYVRKHPFLFFGLPFISLVVASSFALQTFTRTRYDYAAQKVKTLDWEESMGMKEGRQKFDLKEEYYKLSNPAYAQVKAADAEANASKNASLDASRLSADTPSANTAAGSEEGQKVKKNKKKFSFTPVSQDDLENVRVARPEGVPEWGAPGSEDAPVKGKRKEDRWV